MKFKDMEPWQKKRLGGIFLSYVMVSIIFLITACSTLISDRKYEDVTWESSITNTPEADAALAEVSGNAKEVSVGTYVENLKEISIKSSYYRVVFLLWFSWEGDDDLNMLDNYQIYKGYINKQEIVKDYHEDGKNYQLVRVDATVTKNYWTKRFPLESHQLRFYVESEYPADKVVFVNDKENSGLNPNLSIGGYDLRRYDTSVVSIEYSGSHGDPEYTDNVIITEHVTAMEINRASWGLYVKCFIALVGTITWVLITLFINTYHRVDPLGMVPAALFGTVSNIMVGANLLPDALDLGLLEYVNFWGILTILAVTISIINVNRIRNKYEDRDFAGYFGRLMFFTVLFFTLAGHILIPVTAYMFS